MGLSLDRHWTLSSGFLVMSTILIIGTIVCPAFLLYTAFECAETLGIELPEVWGDVKGNHGPFYSPRLACEISLRTMVAIAITAPVLGTIFVFVWFIFKPSKKLRYFLILEGGVAVFVFANFYWLID